MVPQIFVLFFLCGVFAQEQGNTATFDVMRHSFKGPFPKNQILFWDYGAGAYINGTFLRLTPAKQSRTGYLWNNVPSMMVDWEVTIEFHVSGLRHIGGDGFAFWYVEKPELLGPVYGSADYWSGLGILFDTFNNDGRGDNPLITAIVNDGTQRFNPADDGASQSLASCSFPFRNLAQTAFAKITYQDNVLKLQMALHRDSAGTPAFVDCFRIEDVILGIDKFFGLTAHTGDVADNHDIHSFLVKDLTPKTVDLNAVRENYRQRIQYQHAQPSHQEMSPKDFQHEVLTLLNQMQEAINMMEMSQVAIENIVQTMYHSGKEQSGTWEGTVWLADNQAQQLQHTTENVDALVQRVELLHAIAERGNREINFRPLLEDIQNKLNSGLGRLSQEFKTPSEQIRKVSDALRQLQMEINDLNRRVEEGKSSPLVLYFLIFILLIVTGANTFLLIRSKEDSRAAKFL